MKLIFLDFDGVLLTRDFRYFEMGYFGSDPNSIKNLNKIIEATGAKIVVSSTYRHGESESSLCTRLRRWGVVDYGVIGKTPSLWGQPRGLEIQLFLNEWYEDGHEDIDSFVILDDRQDMAHLNDHLILTDNSLGLTEADADKAICVLNHKHYEHVEISINDDGYDNRCQAAACYIGMPQCEVCRKDKAIRLDHHSNKMTCYKCANA